MPITGVTQPDVITIEQDIRLRKFDGVYDFAFAWYQDEETVYLVDGVRQPYTPEKLKRMYEYLDKHGELYFIEALKGNIYEPIGDVTFWKEDMPVVIGDKNYRGRGIGKAVVKALIERGKTLGYDTLSINEIYDYNAASRRCFESVGFIAYEQTECGKRYRLQLEK
jgi:RimJ/RimL family protein N-acetyltransferase